ncbi:response regulator transcription factor [Poseidonibacter sp.]|uniref:response regulator transcription factor n=1 Tax=Poseidonibacter sp. TaxID=2321188 RepID=UPI003C77CF01
MNEISILIVEDETELLERLVKYVSIFCDTIYQATNGYEALCIHEKYKPSIILTDINMPKLTGIEFIEKIRQTDKNSQIIILSAHTHTQDFLKVIPLNLVSYLVKPIKMEQLKNTILEAISKLMSKNNVLLNNGYLWNKENKSLLYKNEVVSLTSYETAFVDCLASKVNQRVSYEEIHNYIYDYNDYSQDAIFTLVKRLRKKTQKDFVKSCFKFGYKIETAF